ncbi:UNVERIFIED_CONTAM: hypothetical protein PYX00_005040 [Menopon gallinae]|uniref:Uncharacterized protein n=1 Tax=Menopon gallinae TaxID=328185 RepID=A0AAW2I701_9NEOP
MPKFEQHDKSREVGRSSADEFTIGSACTTASEGSEVRFGQGKDSSANGFRLAAEETAKQDARDSLSQGQHWSCEIRTDSGFYDRKEPCPKNLDEYHRIELPFKSTSSPRVGKPVEDICGP